MVGWHTTATPPEGGTVGLCESAVNHNYCILTPGYQFVITFDSNHITVVLVAAVIEAIIFFIQAYAVRHIWRVDERPRRAIGWITFGLFSGLLTIYWQINAVDLCIFIVLTILSGWAATGVVEFTQAGKELEDIYEKIKSF